MRANLPHAGYGQGEVLVTTPLRIARVAAALGTDGTIREAPIVDLAPADDRTRRSCPRQPSHGRSASYLREAVVAGTAGC